jgi:hypothetical protein
MGEFIVKGDLEITLVRGVLVGAGDPWDLAGDVPRLRNF